MPDISQCSTGRKIIMKSGSPEGSANSTYISRSRLTGRMLYFKGRGMKPKDYIVDNVGKRIYSIDIKESFMAGEPKFYGYFRPKDENGNLIAEEIVAINSPSNKEYVSLAFSDKTVRKYSLVGKLQKIGTEWYVAIPKTPSSGLIPGGSIGDYVIFGGDSGYVIDILTGDIIDTYATLRVGGASYTPLSLSASDTSELVAFMGSYMYGIVRSVNWFKDNKLISGEVIWNDLPDSFADIKSKNRYNYVTRKGTLFQEMTAKALSWSSWDCSEPDHIINEPWGNFSTQAAGGNPGCNVFWVVNGYQTGPAYSNYAEPRASLFQQGGNSFTFQKTDGTYLNTCWRFMEYSLNLGIKSFETDLSGPFSLRKY